MEQEASYDVETDLFLHDLQFLIATDEQVEDDFSLLCDLLDQASGSDTEPSVASSDVTKDMAGLALHQAPALSVPPAVTPPPQHVNLPTQETRPKRGGRNKYEQRQREELKALKAQVEALKAHLASTKASADESSLGSRNRGTPSPWEVAARDELLERNRAIAENKHLKDALADQATFVEQMQRLFNKKPRLAAASPDPASDEWQGYKLAAQLSLRVAAIHAIADRQYRRLQHAFIQAKLFHSIDAHRVSATPRIQADGTTLLEFKGQYTMDLAFPLVGRACWRAIRNYKPVVADAVYGTDEIDDHTVYQTFTTHVRGKHMHSNMIRKYYPEATRDVVVWRTVLEDALVPHMTRGAVNNKWGWLVAAPLPEDRSKSSLTYLFHAVVDDEDERGNEKPVGVPSEMMAASMANTKCLEEAVTEEIVRAYNESRNANATTNE
ncbi:Aste57867_19620 [Aphanomyces stellatus]|uniref:Aste57867_19620 protein n=1 Tax=Aphanomyces stellatus TaxID=120398 RepID=A0A485LD13_9STRA|nr:hypothetical protein As57867_019556 [Aphanomyces stellatus]VFT96320.1 Aste57867_19620 [Aphanomyces stellatus]